MSWDKKYGHVFLLCLWLKRKYVQTYCWLQNLIFRTVFLRANCLCIWDRMAECTQVFATRMFGALEYYYKGTTFFKSGLWWYHNRSHFTALRGKWGWKWEENESEKRNLTSVRVSHHITSAGEVRRLQLCPGCKLVSLPLSLASASQLREKQLIF